MYRILCKAMSIPSMHLPSTQNKIQQLQTRKAWWRRDRENTYHPYVYEQYQWSPSTQQRESAVDQDLSKVVRTGDIRKPPAWKTQLSHHMGMVVDDAPPDLWE